MAVPEAIKNWIVANYGDGTRVTADGWRKLSDAEMAGALAPLPSGYTKASITDEVMVWAMDNPNYTVTGETPATAPVTAPVYTTKTMGTLAVTAKDSDTGVEVDWGLVRLRSPTATSGGKYVGILPYKGQVEAKTYNVAVTARGYSESVKKATVRANQRTSISVQMYQEKFASLLKIVAGGPAYIDGISFKEFEVVFVNDVRTKDWGRVETTVTDKFQIQMTWYHYEEGVANLPPATELFSQGVLKTERKTLNPDMSSTERHLDFPKWNVPNVPGYYRVTFGLLQG